MRMLGYAVMIVGLIAVVASMNIDVTINHGAGPLVDQGLVTMRRQLTILSAILAAGGVIISVFGGRKR
ncbi:hypothetical protein ACIPL1_18350 [Pseudomonas sp. NPDC090202]|uniref:hypothetical protein n=1 Tax=unclassified Pseudomonas TaxID=196821 RepID=UPI003809D8EE